MRKDGPLKFTPAPGIPAMTKKEMLQATLSPQAIANAKASGKFTPSYRQDVRQQINESFKPLQAARAEQRFYSSPAGKKQIADNRKAMGLTKANFMPGAATPGAMKDGGEAKASRPDTTQPKSEAEFMFDSSNKDMRKQLKGMSPHVTEPVYDSAPTPPPKNTKKETVKKAGGGSCYAKGGMTRADGCAQRGKTRCRII